MVKVLRDFPYSADGFDRHDAKAGDDTDSYDAKIPAAMIEGLTQAGYLAGSILHPEVASKLAGEAAAAGDYAGQVDDVHAVRRDVALAQSGISDGNIGAPEMASILDAHRVTELSSPDVLEKAQKQADEAGKGVKAPKPATAVSEPKAAEPTPAPVKAPTEPLPSPVAPSNPTPPDAA